MADDSPQGQVPGGGDSVSSILSYAISLVESAKSVPLSSSVMVSREELLDLLYRAVDMVPQEIMEARRLLRDKESYLEGVRLEAEEILEAARAQAETFVSKTEVMRQANLKARHLIQEAKEEASKMRFEAEDYADQRLAALEIALVNTLKAVKAGRERLAISVGVREPAKPIVGNSGTLEDDFFDQDES
ncbi:hypothetical protein SAMN02745225_01474 [Ferrithrix thermotolerans DSM 19514]|uniref:ATPase n=1 Tax=Ferrithrix thermotolerans DSM 19514 TaxID=1121881 RepID=A0A1M4VXZ8_9ACTN|nr:ATP synthase F0 subunit B [Ferrithrix thermotolerans]SHE73848.1 hypothetical protein SAMN02745225_01474 [Ferrithrix thermotolerans DSM 19514]